MRLFAIGAFAYINIDYIKEVWTDEHCVFMADGKRIDFNERVFGELMEVLKPSIIAGSQSEFSEKGLVMQKLLKTSVRYLDFSVRALAGMRAVGIETVGDLVRYKPSDLLKCRNFGKTTLNEVMDFLADNGLCLGMDVHQYEVSK